MEGLNYEIAGAGDRPIFLDLRIAKDSAPVVIFCHGYKGFKDWGAWNQVANHFAERDVNFLKFNFSHNGCRKGELIDFPDLKAFGQNNYCLELDDLGKVIDWVLSDSPLKSDAIGLIGHSRGGAIATLKTSEDQRIKALCTWAAVSDFEMRFPIGNDLLEWKKNDVYYVRNGRTGQDMPHYFQFYQNFQDNRDRLDIRERAGLIEVPQLILHGADDEAVHFTEGIRLKRWNPEATLKIINGTGHTFDSKHPWTGETLPKALQEVSEESLRFFRDKLR